MSGFKIGIMANSFRLPFKESIEAAKKLGGEGVQVYAVYGEMAPENLNQTQIAEKRDIVKSNGLVISALCGDLGGHGFQLPEENGWKIEKSKRIIDLALSLDSHIVTTHIGVIPDEKNDTYKTMQEACNTLAEYAESVGAYFAIETGPEKAFLLKEFLDGLSSKGVRVNFDPANLVMITGDDPVKAVYTLKDYIIHTHAKDGIQFKPSDRHEVYGFFATGQGDIKVWDYFAEVPLGQGSVDYNAYLEALKDIGYNGFLTIEREVGDDPAADIKLAVEFLRNKIGEKWN